MWPGRADRVTATLVSVATSHQGGLEGRRHDDLDRHHDPASGHRASRHEWKDPMSTRSRRALGLASSSALSLLTLPGLAAAGLRVTLAQANTPPPSRLRRALPPNPPPSGGPL